jgi:S1-C subfamily serine protease
MKLIASSLVAVAALLASHSIESGARGATETPLSAVPTTSLAPLLSEVMPSVVTIRIIGQRHRPVALQTTTPQLKPDTYPFKSGGTGVVFDADRGLIATNHHVVDGAIAITIGLQDGRVANAELVGVDVGTDIAILKTDLSGLKALQLGDSDALAIGDFIVAIGNPFGLEGTATAGIVSGEMRSDVGHELFESFIQIDAAVNPGNSGGALVNMKGELVGINTAMAGGNGQNLGIAFAIPINMARRVGSRILKDGSLHRGVVGLRTSNISFADLNDLGLSNIHGALVTDVIPGTPAEQAGIKKGSIIVGVNDRPIKTNADYVAWVGSSGVNDVLNLEIQEGQERRTVPVTISDMKIIAASLSLPADTPLMGGLELIPIEPGMPLYGKQQGVVVSGVEAGSEAQRAGFIGGDLIVSLNGVSINSTGQILQMTKSTPLVKRVDISRDERPYFVETVRKSEF